MKYRSRLFNKIVRSTENLFLVMVFYVIVLKKPVKLLVKIVTQNIREGCFSQSRDPPQSRRPKTACGALCEATEK